MGEEEIGKRVRTGLLDSQKPDRLSNLPLPLLHHILSFLPAQAAIQTCILSRRWEHLWASVPSLDLDEKIFLSCHRRRTNFYTSDRSDSSDFSDINDDDSSDEEADEETTQFQDFVENVLFRRDGSNLQKFRLFLYKTRRVWDANKWLCYAAKHHVEQMEIKFSFRATSAEEDYCVPRQLFACESLMDMNLNGCLYLPNAPINLPNLQSLKLACCTIPNIHQLFLHSPKLKDLNLTQCSLTRTDIFDVSSCSCLESLILDGNYLSGIKTINISAPKLKSMTMTTRKYSVHSDGCYSVKISAPNLLYLEYNGYMGKEFSIGNLENLLDAVVGWRFSKDLNDDDAIRSGLEFLKGLEHVRKLRLCRSSIKFLSRVRDLGMHPSTSFINLKFLELMISTSKIDVVQAITFLLKFCPLIETLAVEMKVGNDGGCQESEYSPRRYNLHNLKEVEIRHFQGSHIELKLIKLLLKSANVLERMIFTAPKLDLHKRKEMSLKLQTYPRTSMQILTLFF